MSETTPELPRGVALAWGVAANPQRGPKREMSIESIVDAAVEIADKGGLAAVSMASVAASLGFTPMSLYRYISAKDDLVLLMGERGIGAPPDSIRQAATWREGLRLWAAEQAGMFRDHPWILDIPIVGTPVTPNNLAWLDAALEAMRDVPLDYDTKTACVLAVIAQVRFEGVVMRGYLDTAIANPDQLDLQAEALLHQLVTPEHLPQVHAAMVDGAFSPTAGGDPFSYGLERVLDGIEAFLSGRSPVPPAPADPLDEQAARDPKAREATKHRREVEKTLREARKRERQAIAAAREKLAR
jgi:AcrR family transcriptional regulator